MKAKINGMELEGQVSEISVIIGLIGKTEKQDSKQLDKDFEKATDEFAEEFSEKFSELFAKELEKTGIFDSKTKKKLIMPELKPDTEELHKKFNKFDVRKALNKLKNGEHKTFSKAYKDVTGKGYTREVYKYAVKVAGCKLTELSKKSNS